MGSDQDRAVTPFSAWGAELAWLDEQGVIVAVNDAWTQFCSANGGRIEACGPGSSYLAVCDADPDSAAVGRALRDQLSGRLPVPVVFTVPCDGPASPRWFDLHLSPRLDPSGVVTGAVVALVAVAGPVPGSPERR
jgi:hypothetical protein